MRQTKFLIILLLCLHLMASGQELLDKKVSVHFKKASLHKVLKELTEKNNIYFSYSSNVIPLDKIITLHLRNVSLKKALDDIFQEAEVDYKIVDNQIVLKKGIRRRKTTQVPIPDNFTSSNSTSMILEDSVHKKNVVILTDSIKALKYEVDKLTKVIDSLSQSVEKPKETLANDSLKNDGIMNKLRIQINTLNQKLNKLIIKLEDEVNEEVTSSDTSKVDNTYYFVGYNSVPDGFKFPMIGLINQARGNFAGIIIGLVNKVGGNFKGAQIGLTNLVGGSVTGVTIGLANYAKDNFTGFHSGLLNANTGDNAGANVGLLNYNKGNYKGGRYGLLNINKGDFKGADIGYFNLNGGSFTGIRLGYVNIALKEIKGFSIGFVNIAKNMSGLHIGFLNICDSIKSGVPIGFLSIVRKNGYRAIEVGATEIFHGHASFKIGVKKFYTIFSGGINFKNGFKWAYGVGFGTMFDLKPNKSAINIDGMSYWIREGINSFRRDDFNMLYVLKVNYSSKLVRNIWYFLGPSINMQLATNVDSQESNIASWTPFSNRSGNTNILFWPGINAGIRF